MELLKIQCFNFVFLEFVNFNLLTKKKSQMLTIKSKEKRIQANTNSSGDIIISLSLFFSDFFFNFSYLLSINF